MNLSLLESQLLYAPNNAKLVKKLLSKASIFIDESENLLFAAIAKSKIGDSLAPQKFNWSNSKDTLFVISEKRIVLGYKTLFSTHFEEILPQELKKQYFRKLCDMQALCITTKGASMAIAIENAFVEKAKNAFSQICNTVTEHSEYAIKDDPLLNPPGYFKFPQFNENGKRILKLYTMSVSNLSGDNGILAQQLLEQIKIGEQVLLEVNEKSKENASVKVKNTEGIQIGWLKNGQTLEDHKYRYEIFERLESEETVFARISNKELLKNGNISVKIDVARYSRR